VLPPGPDGDCDELRVYRGFDGVGWQMTYYFPLAGIIAAVILGVLLALFAGFCPHETPPNWISSEHCASSSARFTSPPVPYQG